MNKQFVTYSAIIAGLLIVLLVVGAGVVARRPHKLDQAYYTQKWQDLQKLLKDQTTWPLAIIDADKLLDCALKARKYKGKSAGERLVSAQHDIQDNDAVWYGHKLRNRLVHEHDVKLKERDVKDALLGIKRALKDLGALA